MKIEDEDQTLILLNSLPKIYEYIVDIIFYGKQSLSMYEVKSILISEKIQKKAEHLDGMSLLVKGRANSK